MKATEVALVTGIIGALLGTAGFVIAILAFLRDRLELRVTLQWDMAMVGNPERKIGVVRVANVGRRPVYVGSVSLELPKGYSNTHPVLSASGSGPHSPR
jgi:hypothetical protein